MTILTYIYQLNENPTRPNSADIGGWRLYKPIVSACISGNCGAVGPCMC